MSRPVIPTRQRLICFSRFWSGTRSASDQLAIATGGQNSPLCLRNVIPEKRSVCLGLASPGPSGLLVDSEHRAVNSDDLVAIGLCDSVHSEVNGSRQQNGCDGDGGADIGHLLVVGPPDNTKARPSALAHRHREAPNRERNQAAPIWTLGSITALLKIRGFVSAVTELTKVKTDSYSGAFGGSTRKLFFASFIHCLKTGLSAHAGLLFAQTLIASSKV